MKGQNQRLPMSLFDPQPPNWNVLSSHTQQRVLDVLSHLLRDALDHEQEPTISATTQTQEDVHVS